MVWKFDKAYEVDANPGDASGREKHPHDELVRELDALVDGTRDPVAVMASAVAVIHHKLPYSSWTGFYRVVEEELLRIGPYQGPIGCLERW